MPVRQRVQNEMVLRLMACRTARSLSTLRAEIREQFPQRDEASDGGCASADHSARAPNSRHEPNSAGVATAFDYDEDLHGVGRPAAEMERIVQHVVQLGRDGDPRLDDGHVIYEKRIWSAQRGWIERVYTGPNEHKQHAHIACSSNPAHYDATAPWGIAALFANQGDDMFTDADRATLNACNDRAAQLVAVAHRDIDTLKPLIEQVLQEVKDDPGSGTGAGDVTPEDFVAALKAAL